MIEYIQRRTLIRPCNIEYEDFNCNFYHGCAHGCTYPCYAQGIAREPYERWIRPRVVANTMELLEKEVPRMRARGAFDGKAVLLCSMTDAYQPLETRVGLTRKVLKLLMAYEVPFDILTKSALVVRDFNLLADYPHCRVGFTFAFANEVHREKYEPGASSLADRRGALKLAHDMGLKTWVSCEPIILGASHLPGIIYPLADHVDRWIFGRLSPRHTPREFDVFYTPIRKYIIETCEELGLDYLIKQELLHAPDELERSSVAKPTAHPAPGSSQSLDQFVKPT